MMIGMRSFFLALALAAVLKTPAYAQNFSVSSVSTADFGNVAAASTGQTILRASPATGAVTAVSGAGARISSGMVRSLVTIACAGPPACNSNNALVTISTTGTPTNRAAVLQRFDISVSGATGTLATTPTAGVPISFQLGPIGRNSSKTFWLGFDMPINGDTSAGGTGLSQAQFTITVSQTNGSRSSSLTGIVQANVFRALAIAKTADLAFGKIIIPSSGSGTVTLAQTTGAVTVTGAGTYAFASPAPAAAAFTITGEGGQAVSLFVPSTITMSGPSSSSITVTTTPSISGAQTLSNGLGAGGSLPLRVGGSFGVMSSTQTGTYSGTFTVTVQYN
jgi:hypothetical protein